ncbi:MAG TPA: hypothetical protein GX699_11630 [Firmicutes bacterium]|nr:hypothetical protein [Bacillota bacterium]
MKKRTSTAYFAGANTIYGFYSLFHYIQQPETKRVLIIKGGPGTGKSTLMRQVAGQAQAAGLSTELFFCSSDPESLDAVSIPVLGTVLLDGTAPHMTDPKLPGAYDEIINLGELWERSRLQPHKDSIAELIRQNGNWFVQAYQYLKEAAVVMEKLRWLTAQAMDFWALSKMTHRLLSDLLAALPPAADAPRERQLFGSAITPAGFINHYTSIFQGVERFYLLTGDPGTGKSSLLEQIRQTVKLAGHSVHVYRCGFDPERIDAVVIPVLKTAFAKVTYPHTFSPDPAQFVREQSTLALSRFAKASVLKQHAAERAETSERFWYLLGKAIEMLRSAKRNHDKLEAHYVAAMDFSRLQELREKLCAEIFRSS